MQKFITYILIIMLVLVGFISCENDDGFKNSQHQNEINLKTVSPTDAAKAFKEANSKKSGQSWITPYFQYNDSIGLNNSSAQITVTPVITSVTNAYSRLFSIEINGNLESVLYHMIPNDQSSPNSFWGKVVITYLSGDMLSAFDVEDNLYTGYYDIMNHPETINILEKANNKLNKNGEGGGDEGNNNDNVDDPCDGCAWQDELGAVTVTAPGMTEDEVEIIIIFVPEIYPNHGQDGGVSPIPDNTPQSPTAPAGGTNESCPPGQIKNDNGDCVDPPEEEEVECDEENGYYPDEDGNCVTDPCGKANLQLANSAYQTRFNQLLQNQTQGTESGFGENYNNQFNTLTPTNGGHSLKGLVQDSYSFTHIHPDGLLHSPDDIIQFNNFLWNAHLDGKSLTDIYANVIIDGQLFSLRYAGIIEDLNLNDFNRNQRYFNSWVTKRYGNNIVGFLKYLRHVVKNDYKLYRIDIDNNLVKEYDYDKDNSIFSTNCN